MKSGHFLNHSSESFMAVAISRIHGDEVLLSNARIQQFYIIYFFRRFGSVLYCSYIVPVHCILYVIQNPSTGGIDASAGRYKEHARLFAGTSLASSGTPHIRSKIFLATPYPVCMDMVYVVQVVFRSAQNAICRFTVC